VSDDVRVAARCNGPFSEPARYPFVKGFCLRVLTLAIVKSCQAVETDASKIMAVLNCVDLTGVRPWWLGRPNRSLMLGLTHRSGFHCSAQRSCPQSTKRILIVSSRCLTIAGRLNDLATALRFSVCTPRSEVILGEGIPANLPGIALTHYNTRIVALVVCRSTTCLLKGIAPFSEHTYIVADRNYPIDPSGMAVGL
jgi:hypothetical protein